MFCPALTDGSIGDVICFHTYSNPGLVIDLVQGILYNHTYALYNVSLLFILIQIFVELIVKHLELSTVV